MLRTRLLMKLCTYRCNIGKSAQRSIASSHHSKHQCREGNAQLYLIWNKDQCCLSRRHFSTKQQHTSPPQNSGSTRIVRRKRGAGQLMRNVESAVKAHKSIEQQQKRDEVSSAPNAFFILGIFPLLATGGLLVVRDDLRQEFKERWGL
mmetsp:Transcript_16503/g.31268  ORF Transcript_16503/g.31268 Transcript_16503/m.31268 type:complete len:148 (-) Transcript_16503:33-476(-)